MLRIVLSALIVVVAHLLVGGVPVEYFANRMNAAPVESGGSTNSGCDPVDCPDQRIDCPTSFEFVHRFDCRGLDCENIPEARIKEAAIKHFEKMCLCLIDSCKKGNCTTTPTANDSCEADDSDCRLVDYKYVCVDSTTLRVSLLIAFRCRCP